MTPPPFPFEHHNNREMPKKPKEFIKFVFGSIGDFFYRLFYIFGLVWETSPFILIILSLFAIVQGFLPVIGAFLSKNVINELQLSFGTPDGVFSTVVVLLVALFAYRFAEGLIHRFNAAITRIAGELVVNTTKMKIMNKALEIDISSFDSPEFYEKLENANREASNRPIQILSSTFTVFSQVISLISFVVILSEVSIWAAIVILILALPTAVVNFVFRKKTVNYIKRSAKERRQMNYYSALLVNKDMVKEIRLFGLGPTLINRFKTVFKKYYTGLKKLIISENAFHIVFSIISITVNCAFFAYIAYLTFKGNMLIGDYTFYTGALGSIASSVSAVVGTTAAIYEGTLFVDNLICFMKEKKNIMPTTDEVAEVKRGDHRIEFKNVSFKYPGCEKYVIKNVSVVLEPKDTVVLVGLNGAGKTTFIKLLTRLYDPTEGVILLDGKDIREYEPKELYRLFGIIFQDFGKYADTVAENIRYGDVEAEPNFERIKQAAESTNADVFIDKLSDGYETPLMRIFERNGHEPSIGQWQKLAIARAFYSDCDVLILDEPTASLDAIAEQEVFEQFDRLRSDKITLFVSHRLSSATIANKIIVLSEGEMVETGNHRELMAKKGRYYELFSTQAKRYIEDDLNNQSEP